MHAVAKSPTSSDAASYKTPCPPCHTQRLLWLWFIFRWKHYPVLIFFFYSARISWYRVVRPLVSEAGPKFLGWVSENANGLLPSFHHKSHSVRPQTESGNSLTCEKLFVGTLRHLNTVHCPGIQNLGLHDWRLHEVIVSIAGAFPWLNIMNFICKLIFFSLSRHKVLSLLSNRWYTVNFSRFCFNCSHPITYFLSEFFEWKLFDRFFMTFLLLSELVNHLVHVDAAYCNCHFDFRL